MFPKFPYIFFYWSTLVTIFLTVILAPFAAKLDRSYLTRNFESSTIKAIVSIGQNLILDPYIWQPVSVILLAVLAYNIAKALHYNKIQAFLISLSPIILLGLSFVYVNFILKPGFDYPRPTGYSYLSEAPFTRSIHSMITIDGGTPSSLVVQQMVVMMTTFLYIGHPSLALKKQYRWLIKGISVLMVVVVAFQRIAVNAHTLFDVVFAIASGSMVFWVLYVAPYSIFRKNGAPRAVANMYLVFVALMIFYSKNPYILLVSSLAIILVLLVLDRVSNFMGFTMADVNS